MRYFSKLFEGAQLLFGGRREVYYVVEDQNWSIRHDGLSITASLPTLRGCISSRPWPFFHGAVVHFGSINTFMSERGVAHVAGGNHTVVTWFHVAPGDPRAEKLANVLPLVELWHTSCEMTNRQLCRMGVPADRIVVVPLGVDRTRFRPGDRILRHKLRQDFGIKEDQIVIGSFQKDGNGWGSGMEPKLIKGPDVFCDTVEALRESLNLFVITAVRSLSWLSVIS